MQGVNVKSEIGNLKKVILHRPGNELLNLTPNTLEELLFDDIPFLEVAQAEHDAFAGILRDRGRRGRLPGRRCMAEALETDPGPAREVPRPVDLRGGHPHRSATPQIIKDYINSEYADTKEMVHEDHGRHQSAGAAAAAHPTLLVDMVSDRTKLVCAPMPNLYFTRDPFNMIGNGVGINRMYSTTRNRETIYGDYIFNYHPDFKDVPQYYSRENTFHIEGGDVLNINDHVLAIGISQRTEPDAIDQLAHNVFSDETSTIDTILAFNIPVSRAFMHLDTVFTQIDYDKFTIHPGIMGPLTVFEITPDGNGGTKIRERERGCWSPSWTELRRPAREAHPLRRRRPHRGRARAVERRLQHALRAPRAPMVVYQRNNVTNDVLYKNGINLPGHAVGRALPRPWRPALHVHAGLARGAVSLAEMHKAGIVAIPAFSNCSSGARAGGGIGRRSHKE